MEYAAVSLVEVSAILGCFPVFSENSKESSTIELVLAETHSENS